MADPKNAPQPDFRNGFSLQDLPDGGKVLGRVDTEDAILVRQDDLGYGEPFDAVPFFWSQHSDVTINYVGHAERWNRVDVDGSLDARDCAVTYKRGDRTLAMATISRDLLSLQTELLMEGKR